MDETLSQKLREKQIKVGNINKANPRTKDDNLLLILILVVLPIAGILLILSGI